MNTHTKYEVSMIKYVSRRANQRKVPKWLPFEETISQNNPIGNQHIAEIIVNIHMKYHVSITIYVGRRANQRKLPKWLSFKNYMPESLNI